MVSTQARQFGAQITRLFGTLLVRPLSLVVWFLLWVYLPGLLCWLLDATTEVGVAVSLLLYPAFLLALGNAVYAITKMYRLLATLAILLLGLAFDSLTLRLIAILGAAGLAVRGHELNAMVWRFISRVPLLRHLDERVDPRGIVELFQFFSWIYMTLLPSTLGVVWLFASEDFATGLIGVAVAFTIQLVWVHCLIVAESVSLRQAWRGGLFVFVRMIGHSIWIPLSKDSTTTDDEGVFVGF